jgi:hypothetical protein
MMNWFRARQDSSSDARVEAIRAARKKQGHGLSLLQEAIVRTMAAWEPQQRKDSAESLARIRSAVAADGLWEEQEEWRVMTWFDSKIVESELNNRPWFTTTVSCDGQTFSCGCPSIERAYGFMRLYQELIVGEFYSVGPPWQISRCFNRRRQWQVATWNPTNDSGSS